MPDLEPWRWMLGALCALLLGVAKMGAPGVGTLTVPLMVLTAGDARLAPAWTVPILIVGDIFAVWYWRRHAAARALLSLAPWVAVGMVAGGFALSLSEPTLRRMVGVMVLSMLALNVARRLRPGILVDGHPSFYGMGAGFATTVATSAGPVMNMYLLMKRLPKEQFVATGAWFFFAVNLAKVPIYWSHDLFSRSSLLFDLTMVPAVICGSIGGVWLVRRIPQSFFDRLILVMTALSSILLFR